jgi:integrase
MASVTGHRFYCLLLLALTTGMRRGELLALRWADVDLERGSLRVLRTVDYLPHYGFVEERPKTRKSRRNILLAPVVIEALRQHRKEQEQLRAQVGEAWVEKDLVFTNLWGDYLSPNALLKAFARLIKQAGLRPIRFHDLRHSTASILMTLGIHPKVIQELLGHSTIQLTLDTYTEVLPNIQRAVVEKWQEVFNQQGEEEAKGGGELPE